MTEEQVMMREALARYLGNLRAGKAGMRAAGLTAQGWDSRAWQAFATELGVLAVSFPPDQGGLGGGLSDNVIVMEELGRALLGEPYLSTVVVGGGFLKGAGGPLAAELIPRIIAGEAIIAFAFTEPAGRYNLVNVGTTARREGGGYVVNGRKSLVYAAPWATQLIVTARTAGATTDPEGISLFLLDSKTPGIRRRDFTTIDGTAASEIFLEDVHATGDRLLGAEGNASPLVERVVDEAIVALCGDAIGVLRQLNDATVCYARQRRQFGRAIAEFQVLQHRMVDMYVELQQAVSITTMASLTVNAPSDERAQAVSAAKWRVGKACRFIAQSAVQIHGGIGTTAELPVSLYFKRATAFERRFGSSDHHLQRYTQLMRARATWL